MGVVERSREVMAVMALHDALRNVCISSDWTYSVFWTIRPRPRLRGGLGCKAGDEGSLMLMWEDGYCRPAGCCSADAAGDNKIEVATTTPPLAASIHRVHGGFSLGDDVEEEDPVRKAFRKMSIQLYNYGEGLMGKVASDKCHKWVFRESSETEVGPLNYWQSSFDSHPPEWMDQFSAGIQTIAVIQAGHGLLQLGSCKIVAEDLHFVLRMRYTFESLENQAGGGFLSQTFAPMRNRFFCGSPTGAAAAPSAPTWQNNQAAYFHTAAASSDFRLRLGVACDPVIQPPATDDPSVASLRLSLQNGTSNFDFRSGVVEQDGDTVVAAGASQAFTGMKRPAASTDGDVATVPGTPGANLLARRLQYQSTKPVTATTNGLSTSFQELLQSGSSNNNFTGGGVFHAPRHEHATNLMVQIPPVISSASPMVSPMISPGGSNKLQKTGNGSSSSNSNVIQAALQDALERAARAGSSACSSPLPVRLSKLAPEQSQQQQQQQYGSGTTPGSQSATPKPLAASEAPATTTTVAAAAAAATPPQQHSHYPGSHPGTPASKDNYHSMNNNNANACLVVDHSSAMLVSSNGGDSNHANVKAEQQHPLHFPAATSAWENLKESCLDLPRRAPPPPPPSSAATSGEVYPEFMESFFE